ncbi:MAG: TraR/DksA C4-type zinc finger protein [Dehalococcoidia bacterium]|nr:TraR/DksA C4-type zinc finger protein [Dehalococcoidia bacterium]
MADTNYQAIKIRIEKDREQLNDQLEQIRTARTANERREGSPFGKREEEASETAELENLIAQEKRILDQLVDIDLAVKKLDNGTYGQCQKCGEQIEAARLEAIPIAKICMKCAQIKK